MSGDDNVVQLSDHKEPPFSHDHHLLQVMHALHAAATTIVAKNRKPPAAVDVYRVIMSDPKRAAWWRAILKEEKKQRWQQIRAQHKKEREAQQTRINDALSKLTAEDRAKLGIKPKRKK